jgi:hypothetical protein
MRQYTSHRVNLKTDLKPPFDMVVRAEGGPLIVDSNCKALLEVRGEGLFRDDYSLTRFSEIVTEAMNVAAVQGKFDDSQF